MPKIKKTSFEFVCERLTRIIRDNDMRGEREREKKRFNKKDKHV